MDLFQLRKLGLHWFNIYLRFNILIIGFNMSNNQICHVILRYACDIVLTERKLQIMKFPGMSCIIAWIKCICKNINLNFV